MPAGTCRRCAPKTIRRLTAMPPLIRRVDMPRALRRADTEIDAPNEIDDLPLAQPDLAADLHQDGGPPLTGQLLVVQPTRLLAAISGRARTLERRQLMLRELQQRLAERATRMLSRIQVAAKPLTARALANWTPLLAGGAGWSERRPPRELGASVGRRQLR
jgi:hypothetical protein